MFLPHSFDVFGDLLLNSSTKTWNLSASYNRETNLKIYLLIITKNESKSENNLTYIHDPHPHAIGQNVSRDGICPS